MSSFTPNIDLLLTPADDTTTTFKEWRVGINGENDNSNMAKIDKAIGDLNQNCSELSAKVDTVFDKKSVQTWKDVQSIVRSGLASKYFNIGDQFVVERLINVTASVRGSTDIIAATIDANKFVEGVGETKSGEYLFKFDNHSWHDTDGSAIKLADYGITVTGTPRANDTVTVTETTEQLTFDVIGIDHDTPADKNYTHSMTLQLHDVLTTDFIYDGSEAAWYIDEASYPKGLSAGTYHFLATTEWDNDTYCFTITKNVPVGGQIVYDFNDLQVITYSSATSTTAIETVSFDIGDDGAALPDILYNAKTDNANDIYRYWGSGNWAESALRQWLNTSEDANTWWKPMTVFDRPPAYAATTDGFLKNIDYSFLNVLGDVIKTTQRSITDGYGLETSVERFFLLSRSEVYANAEREDDGAEGTVYPYYGVEYSNLSAPDTSADRNRVKYKNGSTYFYWLRTPLVDYGSSVRRVVSTGSLSASHAYVSGGVAPACVII